jgi:hypothetical protein
MLLNGGLTRSSHSVGRNERTILSGNSPYHRFNAGDKKALSPSVQRIPVHWYAFISSFHVFGITKTRRVPLE